MKKLLKMTLLALALTPAIALAQQQFSSPEQAASALAEAIDAGAEGLGLAPMRLLKPAR